MDKNILLECPECGEVRLVKEWEAFTKHKRDCTALVPMGEAEGDNEYFCPCCESEVALERIKALF